MLVGHSGVGKSTLVNALVPGRRPGDRRVNAVTGRGRHTSSSAIALPLPDAAAGSSTPRACARSAWPTCSADDVLGGAFPDLAGRAAEECPPGAAPTAEADCGLDAWVAAGTVRRRHRLDALRRLLSSREGEDND